MIYPDGTMDVMILGLSWRRKIVGWETVYGIRLPVPQINVDEQYHYRVGDFIPFITRIT